MRLSTPSTLSRSVKCPYNSIVCKEVILKEQVPRILETLYEDDEIGMGKGIDGFYKVVRDRYLGVSKKDVENLFKETTRVSIATTGDRVQNKQTNSNTSERA